LASGADGRRSDGRESSARNMWGARRARGRTPRSTSPRGRPHRRLAKEPESARLLRRHDDPCVGEGPPNALREIGALRRGAKESIEDGARHGEITIDGPAAEADGSASHRTRRSRSGRVTVGAARAGGSCRACRGAAGCGGRKAARRSRGPSRGRPGGWAVAPSVTRPRSIWRNERPSRLNAAGPCSWTLHGPGADRAVAGRHAHSARSRRSAQSGTVR
jgi:hypothetical protein